MVTNTTRLIFVWAEDWGRFHAPSTTATTGPDNCPRLPAVTMVTNTWSPPARHHQNYYDVNIAHLVDVHHRSHPAEQRAVRGEQTGLAAEPK